MEVIAQNNREGVRESLDRVFLQPDLLKKKSLSLVPFMGLAIFAFLAEMLLDFLLDEAVLFSDIVQVFLHSFFDILIFLVLLYSIVYYPLKKRWSLERSASEKLYELSQTIMVISTFNYLLVRAVTEEDLLKDACEVIVKKAGFCFAWVGYVQFDEEKTVKPMSWAGKEEGYLQGITVRWGGDERGRGPVGTAIRTGQYCAVENIREENKFRPWLEEARERGYASLLALPLINEGRVFGVLVIYSFQPGVFTDRKLVVLDEVRNDLVYGIFSLRSRNMQKEMIHECTKELRQANQKLMDEISDRIKTEEALRKAKEKAEEATKLKDKFVSLVAHDLRSPFNALLGYLQIMLSDTDNPLSPKNRERMERLYENGQGLLTMIDELLNISRLQTGAIQPQFKFFDGYLTTQTVKCKMDFLAREKGVRLVNHVPKGTRLYGDYSLFSEVLLNLVSNAIKFCGQGGEATFFIPQGQNTTIALKDTGVGINQVFLPDLFKHEVKTTCKGTAGEKGTGLGLPYSHDIMAAHGGDLVAESSNGSGTVFYARFPFVVPVVLVVEDDPSHRGIITEYLKEIDGKVVEAENGKEALAILKTETPHIILADVNMPEIGGFALLDKIRGNEKTRHIPFIIITGDNHTDSRETAFQKGANDYINKPIQREDLIPRLRRFIV